MDKSTALTIEALMDMTPVVDGRDLVRLAARHLFLGSVRQHESVQETFFPSAPREHGGEYSHAIEAALSWFETKDYAVLFVCQAMCRIQDEFGIHELLNEEKIEERLTSAYNSSGWKKVGQKLNVLIVLSNYVVNSAMCACLTMLSTVLSVL